MKETTAQFSQDFVGIYPEDLFSNDWWNSQVGNDQLLGEIE